MSKVQAIRNPDGHWVNSQCFREEALHFIKYGYYCPDPWGSPSWIEYWQEQDRRCKEGYSSGGAKITGNQYFYQNFTQIKKAVKLKGNVAKKIISFPDFWDGDYNYFWALEIARNGMGTAEYEGLNLVSKIHPDYLTGGNHMIVGKSRRKGYSFKNGSICVNAYNTVRGAEILLGAFDKKFLYPKGTMGMATQYMNFLNEHTGWRKSRDYVDKQDHKRASFKEVINGVAIEKGFMSEIIALSFKDNPDAARGKDAYYVLFEEAGAFPNLKASYNATKPALEAGDYITGQIIIFGTGGDMESGTADYADMFYNPKRYDLLPFVNIWDDDSENSTCGFFHPVYMNMEGHYDGQGNSNILTATESENAKRKDLIAESSDSSAYQDRIQEYPFCPSEAFLTVSTNNFPVAELRNQLRKVKAEKLHLTKCQPVFLYKEEREGKLTVIARPDLKGELEPIYDFKPKIKNLKGAVIIQEYPMDNAPRGLYKIGYDPYAQDRSTTTSLGAVYVYKGVAKGQYTRDQLVAWYVGRPGEADDMNEASLLLAELYNTECMHENMFIHVKNYYRQKKKLHRLAAQPDVVISKNVKHSKVARIYGIHMNDQLKDAGEKYIKDWLLKTIDHDENGDKVRTIDKLYDIGLIEELISYNRKGNFDRVMALMMVMFQIEEEEEGKEYMSSGKSTVSEDLLTLKKTMFSSKRKRALSSYK